MTAPAVACCCLLVIALFVTSEMVVAFPAQHEPVEQAQDSGKPVSLASCLRHNPHADLQWDPSRKHSKCFKPCHNQKQAEVG